MRRRCRVGIDCVAMKNYSLSLFVLMLVSCSHVKDSDSSRVVGTQADQCGEVGVIPDSIRKDFSLDPFYRKYINASGLPVLSSDAPDDIALQRACRLLLNMLSQRADVRDKLIELKARFVVIGKDEGTADVPEYGFRDRPQADKDAVNARARGIGGQASSCGEENLRCMTKDRYPNESICVHEFSHTIREGVYQADPSFAQRLESAFESSKSSGILDGSYRRENFDEYWAEGVQDWYDTNAQADPPDGISNAVNTRIELKEFAPDLYALIDEVFPADISWGDCHSKTADSHRDVVK